MKNPFKAALIVACICVASHAGPADLRDQTDLRRQVEAYRTAHEAAIVGQLDELIRIRSIAADPTGIATAANQLESSLKTRGFAVRRLSAEPGTPPLVFGELKSPGATHTVVFYAHYDGQPVTPSDWSSDPFTPVMREAPLNADPHDIAWQNAKPPFGPEWRLFGRAASDDKASIVAFFAAFDALKAAGRKPAVNIKVVWEGEEEAGSPHLAEILRNNQTLLAADLWLIGDAPVHQSRRPMLYFGARGTLGLEATIYGPPPRCTTATTATGSPIRPPWRRPSLPNCATTRDGF